MPKFLVQVKYTADGTKGVLKDGGSGRRKVVEDFMSAMGGTLDVFYFMLGEDDAVLIIDLPDTERALAVAMSVRASGAIVSRMTPLIPVDEVDAAVGLHARYHAPGE